MRRTTSGTALPSEGTCRRGMGACASTGTSSHARMHAWHGCARKLGRVIAGVHACVAWVRAQARARDRTFAKTGFTPLYTAIYI
eukprot:365154-Chlamydomonas_euryale.AAC.12